MWARQGRGDNAGRFRAGGHRCGPDRGRGNNAGWGGGGSDVGQTGEEATIFVYSVLCMMHYNK